MNTNQLQTIFVNDSLKDNINPGASDEAKLFMKATLKKNDDNKFDINDKGYKQF